MSLSKTIHEAIEHNINKYISLLVEKYDLDQVELVKLWTGETPFKKQSEPKKTTSENKDENLDKDLLKLGKKELVEMCKSKSLAVSGSKADLVKRITGVSSTTTTQKKTVTTQKKEESSIIKKLVEKIPAIQIKKNSHGNYIHEETGFVFNNATKRAYGKQNEDGSVSELTKEDINLCNKFKFSYDIPENLNKKNSGDDDDEEDEEMDDELEEVEEELEEELEDEEDEEEVVEEEEEYYEEE